MKICIVSDLHLEFGFYPANFPQDGGDVLIVAGDLTCARYLSKYRTDKEASRQKKLVDRFVDEWTTKFKRTYYVMGNHEHYGYVLPESSKLISNYLSGTNIKVMDPGQEIFEDVLFVGATLWTDFNKNNPLEKVKIENGMNDYRTIFRKDPIHLTYEENKSPNKNIKYGLIYADIILEQYNRDRNFIVQTLNENKSRKTVVITHHAPDFRFNGHEHAGDLKHAYCSDQSALILDNPQIALWACGHTHNNEDFNLPGSPTRLVSNCMGYHGYEMIAETFKPKVIEI